jgi:3-hydroxybutyrate dehydrogenase
MTANLARPLGGRCALVTGSTAGIGLDTARSLASIGADLVLNGFGDPVHVADICASLAEQYSVRVIHHAADVSKPDQVESLVAAAQVHGQGRLDILVNNAGFSFDAAIESITPERWDSLLAVNLSAPFHAIRCALPGMRAHGWGRIVNVASVHGLVGMLYRGGYVAAKHGLIGLTKVVALETADTPITCNAVCPGLVGTDRVVQGHRQQARETGVTVEEVQREAMTARQPSGNYIPSTDVAAAIAFLCGPNAGEVRGATWTLDGGWSAR